MAINQINKESEPAIMLFFDALMFAIGGTVYGAERLLDVNELERHCC
jgi:hypothetical protein